MLEKLRKSESKGFTLIEIVLVLAIAGLIMVIVFLAVAGAQRARRDTQRRTDAGRFLAAIEQCASNNNGDYTKCNTVALMGPFTPTNFNDPTTATGYVIKAFTTAGALTACPGATTPAEVYTDIKGTQAQVRMCGEQGPADVKNF